MNKVELMNEARANKTLDKVYRFSTGVMSLREYINKTNWVRKSIHIRNHSRKRIELEYKKIKDTYEYTLWKGDNKGTDVPKLVYDSFDLPETIHDNRF